jgi:hypothetical protein
MSERMTTKHQKALTSLLAGGNLQDAASAASVEKRTIYRWLEKPAFYEELQRRKNKAIDAASVRLAGGMDKAIGVMITIMDDLDTPAGIRLRAANYYLSHALRYVELNDVIARIDELERRLNHEKL